MTKVNEATLAQIRAAAPYNSTWVSANAGSGKTRVLTNRVARLLLQGTEPQKILCLTYTKAAAAEMQNRLFERLGEWSMKPDADLRNALEELGEQPDSLEPETLARARTLFASALETPGGLKIQTIHSFCERVLRRFPLEAGVSPQFKVLEDRQAKTLRAEIFDQVAEGSDGDLVAQVGQYFTGMDPDELLGGIIKNSQSLLWPVEPEQFELSGDETAQSLWDETLSDQDADDLRLCVKPCLANEKGNDLKYAKQVIASLAEADPNARLRGLEKVLLSGSGEFQNQPRILSKQSFPTKGFQKDHPAETDRLRDYMERIADARHTRLAILAHKRATLLHQFAKVFVAEYQTRKAGMGVLDFDDQINRTADLLTTQDMAQWVLYKLDGGIDHILVDEAQDTSPAQWRVVKQLSAEFNSGEGARDVDRTVFVVGDQKQSIYSFQGADPDSFDEMRTYFKGQLRDSDALLNEQDLLFSFRSAPPILELVDQVASATKEGLPRTVLHTPFWSEKAGCVDLWPFIEKEEKPEEQPWFTPLDRPAPDDPLILLANQIADHIETVLASGMMLDFGEDRRPVRPGDFLILVRGRRSVLFSAIIKALKSNDLPVAGADRLWIADELAVKDILSLLQFMALPEDDLSLAEALRSPIFSVTEGQLFELAHDRGKQSLWQALRESDAFSATHEILSQLLKRADFDRPYDLIEMILSQFGGRQNLLARLGKEAEDAIDELLNQAMNYEQVEAPTLTGFLEWFATGDVEVKRQLDNDADLIRVMTVHGAKGLEAPIVILPDTAAKRKGGQSNPLIVAEDGQVFWRSGKDKSDPEAAAGAHQSARDDAEASRILYVALTRAENWLIVCGAGKRGTDCWYDQVADGLTELGTHPQEIDGQMVTRFCNQGWLDTDHGPVWEAATATSVSVPDWATQVAPKMDRAKRPIAPSKLPGAKALAGDDGQDTDAAMRRGSMLHLLLEVLPDIPAADRELRGTNVLNARFEDANAEEVNELVKTATNLIAAPNLTHIFGPNSLSEVAVTAPISELNQRPIEGSIDRLIVEDDKITIVDFKSNATVPETPKQTPLGVLRQLAVYWSAVSQIYPDRLIQVQILWTQTPQLMTIPHDIVKESLQMLQHLDDL